ncbi:MAG TPA: ribosome-associated translation inhibitor RaiA [Candidatus Paceibacterota bacterium]|nr:ribosome-associated translation inhibitor RaiA [Candidatus Paceibacterota bacterium]
MHIDIYAKNIELDEPLRVFVNEKIGDLEHLMAGMGQSDEIRARVEIGKPGEHHHKGRIWYAEANIHVGQSNDLFRASCTHEDLRYAITDVKDELQRQLKKYREKMTEKDRRPREE